MKSITKKSRVRLGTALAALAIGFGSVTASAPASAAPKAGSFRPSQTVLLSTGEGQVVRLPAAVSDVWTSNPAVADVYVSNQRQINLFGKADGEATVVATSANGTVVYSANVRVSQNITSVDAMLRAAMPQANIKVLNAGQLAVLTGTVGSPDEAAQAQQLVAAMLNPGVDMSKDGATCKICVVNRLNVATPLQVNLKVRIAEVNRSLTKSIGVNLFSSDPTSGFKFGIGQGSSGATSGPGSSPFDVGSLLTGGTTLGAAGKLFGLDLAGAIDLAAKDGLVTILAEPNLTALSGETASFLAGGEFPIPVGQGNNAVTIEYKQYGVGLAFTPIVLADGRISMRVRPEVSELSNEGSVKTGDFIVPALITRRAETTVELGSGQSFMIAGLLRNSNTNSINKAPFLGDLPILGALFRSTSYQRSETELVIIVTPYLVRPSSHQLVLPTDGYRTPNDAQGILGGQAYTGVSGPRPVAPAPAPGMSAGAAVTASPGFKQ
jgi:pilus assembly protein CpaC